ncbi:NAD(P)-binding protein [Sarocladium strictum]
MASLIGSPAGNAIDATRRFLLSPLLSGPLVLATTTASNGTSTTLNTITKHMIDLGLLSPVASDRQRYAFILRVLFGISLARFINKKLSSFAANAWRVRAADGWEWRNEIAVVTGGSGGIGRNIAERLAKLGVKVAILDVMELPAALEQNPLIRFYKCDITSFDSVAKAADAIREDFGHPSILINNAGIANADPLPILDDSEAFLKKVFAVNCVGLWATTKQFLPHMISENKGHVVTLSSIAAFTTFPAGVGYSASKAAALSFHEGLTCELKHMYKAPNVMTTVFHPNFVRTPLLGRMIEGLEKAGVRLMEPDTVAKAIVAQIVSKKGAQVFVPPPSSVVSGIRGWSTWLQEIVRDGSGKIAARS